MIGRLNHVAIAVRDLGKASATYRDILGANVSAAVPQPDHGVTTVFITLPNTKIELLEPLNPDGGVGKFLARRGGGLHHVCFESDSVDADLEAARAKGLPLIDQKPRKGLAGMICFLHPKATRGVLVEYAQPLED